MHTWQAGGKAKERRRRCEGIGLGRVAGGGHLSNNARKRQLAQQELRRLLKVPNLSKRTHAGTGAAFFYGTPCANVMNR